MVSARKCEEKERTNRREEEEGGERKSNVVGGEHARSPLALFLSLDNRQTASSGGGYAFVVTLFRWSYSVSLVQLSYDLIKHPPTLCDTNTACPPKPTLFSSTTEKKCDMQGKVG